MHGVRSHRINEAPFAQGQPKQRLVVGEHADNHIGVLDRIAWGISCQPTSPHECLSPGVRTVIDGHLKAGLEQARSHANTHPAQTEKGDMLTHRSSVGPKPRLRVNSRGKPPEWWPASPGWGAC